MTFKKLESVIASIRKQYGEECDNLKVCIPVKVIGTVGGIPNVEVHSIYHGIDWDNNKLIVLPEKDLRETNRDEIKQLIEKYDELASYSRVIQELRREIKKLKSNERTINII